MLLLALPAAGPVDHGDRDGVHQVVDLLLDAVHGVGGHEEVPLVQVLDRWAILTSTLITFYSTRLHYYGLSPDRRESREETIS